LAIQSGGAAENKVFHALADPSRRAIFESLTRGEAGRRVYYRVQPRGIEPLIGWIAHYRAFWTEHVDRLERLWRR
jgi:hypothetical protein